MRASELIGREVTDAGGKAIGVVTDVRCVDDGPLPGSNAALRIDSLLVSRHHTGSVLGYERGRKQGPLVIRLLVRWLHRHMVEVPWSDIEEEGPPLRLKPR